MRAQSTMVRRWGREVEDGMEGGVHLDGFGDTWAEVVAVYADLGGGAERATEGDCGVC